MFEFQFSTRKVKYISNTSIPRYKKLMPLMWGEHCMECSAPECYTTCIRYASRCDGHCRRFSNGVEPILRNGVVAAKVCFKDWGKLEAYVCDYTVSDTEYSLAYGKSKRVGSFCAFMSGLMPGFALKSKWYGAWTAYNNIICSKIKHFPITTPIKLVATIENKDRPSSIFIDLLAATKDMLAREIIKVPLGITRIDLELNRISEASVINIHPVNAEEKLELIFEELEVVTAVSTVEKSKKVKCVIWDLDNTLWDGVLIESKEVQPKAELISLIKALDNKGIVNSIASKNNEEQVLPILRKAGIEELFVFKKINWNSKSQNIRKTIKDMNINADTVVFVDDNPFEREEVKSVLPDITCMDPSEIIDYTMTERFNIIVSEESSKRRNTYKMLEALKIEEENWSGSIDEFLFTCQIKLQISKPNNDNIDRCYELLQRTNQLNASGRRLSRSEVEEIITSEFYDSYVLESSDKFGSYGIVGFMIVDKANEIPIITDFVISCRVANKKIEPTIINYLSLKYGGKICFNFKKTKLNGPMKNVIDELSMKFEYADADTEVYVHNKTDYPRIVELIDLTV